MASTALKFIWSNDDFFVKGYRIGPTRQQLRDRFRGIGGIDMMPNQAFDIGLFAAGFRVPAPRTRASGLSLDGTAYELKFLNRHLPGTNEAAKQIAGDGKAFLFDDLSTLSRVESEIFSRGVYTGSRDGFARYGFRFDEPIGSRVASDGTRTALHYGELKMRANGLYHVVPRTRPSKVGP